MKDSFFHNIRLLLTAIFLMAGFFCALSADYLPGTLSLSDGIAHPTVKCVLRDSKDYLWIGTRGGLNKVDKGKVATYRRNPSQKNSLPDNDILEVFEDSNGRVWVICSTGVAYYDRATDSFQPVYVDGHVMRSRSHLLLQSGILFGGAGSIYFYDYSTDTITPKPIKGGSDKYYSAIHPWTRDRYLLATRWDGLWLYNSKTSEIEPFPFYKGKRIMTTLIDNDGDLWISEYGEGLNLISRSGQAMPLPSKELQGPSIILDMIESDDKLFFATDGNGVICLNKATGDVSRINENEYFPGSIRSVNCLYNDNFGYIYAGTVRGGLIYMHPTPMQTIGLSPEMEAFTVTTIVPDHNRFWLGIDGKGLMLYELDNANRVTPMPSTSGLKIVSMDNFNDKSLLVSTYDNGLYLFDKESGTLSGVPNWLQRISDDNRSTGIPMDVKRLPGDKIALITDKIYISNLSGSEVEEIRSKEGNNRLRVFHSDMGNLLCYSDQSLYHVDPDEKTMSLLYQAPDRIMECATFDGERYIYTGTSSGVERYDFETGEVTTPPNLLPPGSGVTAIAYNDGKLWIGALGKLFMGILPEGKILGFGPDDGVAPNEFIYKSIISTPQHLLMGGVNGLLRINLNELNHYQVNKYNSQLTLGEVLIDGLPVAMKGNVAKLPDDYSTVKLRFTGGTANPVVPEAVRIFIGQHNLDSPIETSDNTLTLGHLQSTRGGRYDIYASVKDADGQWSKPDHVGAIVVPVAWWRKPFAIVLICILGATALILAIVYFYSHKRNKLINRIEENKRQSLEQEVGFLINLNYELRTPLTLIYSRLKILTDSVSKGNIPEEKVIEELDNIYRNTGKMCDIINTTVDHWREKDMNSEENKKSLERVTPLVSLEEKIEDPHDFDLSHLTVIVVEDDPELRELLVSSLSSDFKRVLEASNGKDALTYIKNSNPDLIITEARLPQMTGLELCRIIKKTKEYSHIPVIMLTTRLEEMSIANGNNYGADNYLTKPFDIGVLEKRCVSVLKSFDRVKQWYRSQASDILPKDRRQTNEAEAFVLKVREIIEQNISTAGFGVDDIVEKMLVSRSTLYSRFKELTGQSLGNYINDYKVNRAKEMLSTTDMTMVEISDALGFTTQRYFSTFFKDKTGMTPTAFRHS